MTYLTRQFLGVLTTLIALVGTIYLADKLGITDENLTFHSSRNTFIYRALENNIKPHIVQKIVGHKSIEQTMQYVTQQIRLVSDADLEQVFNHKANQVNGVI